MGTRKSCNTVDLAAGTVYEETASKTVTLFSVYFAMPTEALHARSTGITEGDGKEMVFESLTVPCGVFRYVVCYGLGAKCPQQVHVFEPLISSCLGRL